MKSFYSLGLLMAATAVQGLNILITNDDGFGSANIREMYKAMKEYGHDCFIVASVTDMSGQGGRAVFTTEKNLTTDSEFGLIKAGSPSLGSDPLDSHIWYYNGTPAAQVFVALDYVLPRHANFSVPDLVLSGPNFGLNLGPFLYTLSGTMGATYSAIERGIPAIAYSAGNNKQTSYQWINATTPAGLPDPATLHGRLAANLAQGFIEKAQAEGKDRILPLGYGINVNQPFLTSFTNASCVNPPFVLTRMTGGADVDYAAYNATTGLFHYENVVKDGVNACIHGDCGLPGETQVLDRGDCKSAVSVFTVDYDAPYKGECAAVVSPYALMPSIVQLNNSTNLVGGLGANTTVSGGSGSGSGSGGSGSGSNSTSSNSTTWTPTVSPSTTFSTTSTPVIVNNAGRIQGVGMAMSVLAAMLLL